MKPGDKVEAETPLITLETDKAAMEVPARAAGRVAEMLVQEGGKVAKGTLIVRLEVAGRRGACSARPRRRGIERRALERGIAAAPVAPAALRRRRLTGRRGRSQVPLLVLGAGPGGYPAAFRAADLGLNVTLVERWPSSAASA